VVTTLVRSSLRLLFNTNLPTVLTSDHLGSKAVGSVVFLALWPEPLFFLIVDSSLFAPKLLWLTQLTQADTLNAEPWVNPIEGSPHRTQMLGTY